MRQAAQEAVDAVAAAYEWSRTAPSPSTMNGIKRTGLRWPSPPTVTVEIGPHAFDDAADAYEDGEPGRCAFPLCTLPPEEHGPAAPHDCEEHPELPGRCRECGLLLPVKP